MSVALDDSAAAAKEWVDAADPTPTFPVLVDREHLLGELYGITNVPSVVWIDEDDHIVRAPVIAPGDDQFKDFTNIDSSVHHDQLRRVGARRARCPRTPTTVRARQPVPTEAEQLARLERRVGAYLARDGRTEARRAALRPRATSSRRWTSRSGAARSRCAARTRSARPFFDFYAEWEAAGSPGTDSADEVWTNSP